MIGTSSDGEPGLHVLGGHGGGETHGGAVPTEAVVVRIYDPADGRLREEWLLPSGASDRILDAAQDPDTHVLTVGGQTYEAFAGQISAGSCDAYFAQLPR